MALQYFFRSLFFSFFSVIGFSCLASPLFSENAENALSEHRLQIHLFGDFNEVGLEADQQILKSAIEELGHSVHCFHWSQVPEEIADINLFLQYIPLDMPSKALINWFIPNPECFVNSLDVLGRIDLILCRTKEVERIFQKSGKETYFLGFTSKDCYLPEIEKQFIQCVHLPGQSPYKGTETLVKLWRQHPEMPRLIIVKWNQSANPHLSNPLWIGNRLPLSGFLVLQNSIGIHLCPSETEGFGHYISEAMSTGAVVVTTDAPPMNEFISDPRCLVPYSSTSIQQLGVKYHVDEQQLYNQLLQLLQLPESELQKIGRKNREQYLKRDREFHLQLAHLLEETSTKLTEEGGAAAYLLRRMDKTNRYYGAYLSLLPLLKQTKAKTLLETGTARYGKDSFSRDGGSTIILGDWAHREGATLYSVDINPYAIERAREATASFASSLQFIRSDSVRFLEDFSKPIDFLYLDSCDFSEDNPRPFQELHLNEIVAAYPKFHSKTIVMVNGWDQPFGGKGKLAVDFLIEKGWKVVYMGPQVILIQRDKEQEVQSDHHPLMTK